MSNSRSTTPSGLSRSGSLTDRLRSSFKGGMSSFKAKKPQDNARLKARLSKEPPTRPSRPSSAAAAEVINDKTTNGKPVELPANKQPQRKVTAETTNSSVLDPAYSPGNKKFRRSHPDSELTVPPVGNETSVFEDDSSSEEEAESPVIQRASSVRVAKPVLVRNVSNAAHAVGHSTPLRKESDRPVTPENQSETKMDGRADALRALEANSAKPLPTPPPTSHGVSATITGSDLTMSPASTVFTSMQAPSTPPSTTSTNDQQPPATPPITISTPLSPLSALRSNPVTPSTELASARLSRALSAPTPPNRNPNRRVTIRPSDLVINEGHDHRLFRESIITTPYPGSADKKKRLSNIADHDEPSRPNSMGSDESSNTKPPMQLLSPHALSTTMSPHGPGDRDRFPSLTSTESLFITLSLSNRPNSASTLEVSIPLTPTQPWQSLSLRRKSRRLSKPNPIAAPAFDDSNLFTLLRSHYHSKLIGSLPKRAFLLPTRTLSGAECVPTSVNTNSNDVPFLNDPVDFLAHLRNPNLGKGKRNWLLWLRNNQHAPSPSHIPLRRAGPLGSFSTAATETPIAANPPAAAADTNKAATAIIANGGTFLASPTATSLSSPKSRVSHHGSGSRSSYPRMPFQRPSSILNNNNQNITTTTSRGNTNNTTTTGPHITLTHRTNPLTLSLATLIIFLAGLLTVLLWVLVGVPGLAAGQSFPTSSFNPATAPTGANTTDTSIMPGNVNIIGTSSLDNVRAAASYGDWRVDAQMRVLTGLVLGAVVWFGGAVGAVGWWGLGWILVW